MKKILLIIAVFAVAVIACAASSPSSQEEIGTVPTHTVESKTTPTPTVEKKNEWVQVMKVSGSSSKKTAPFKITGKMWKVVWTIKDTKYASFTLYTHKTGEEFYDEALVMFADKSGESMVYSKGEMYLDITSVNTGWTVTVYELK